MKNEYVELMERRCRSAADEEKAEAVLGAIWAASSVTSPDLFCHSQPPHSAMILRLAHSNHRHHDPSAGHAQSVS